MGPIENDGETESSSGGKGAPVLRAGSCSPSGAAHEAAGRDAATSLTLGFIWHALQQNVLLSSAIGLAIACLASAAVWFLFEPVYHAESWLRIVDSQPYIVFPNNDDSRRFVDTQVELVQSPYILRRALELPEVANLPEIQQISRSQEPLNWIQERLKVRPVGKSELLNVGFTGPDAEHAALIVNTIVSVYIDMQNKEFNHRRQTFLDLLVEERGVRERGLEHLRAALTELAKSAGGDGALAAEAAGQVVINPYSLLSNHEQRLADAQVELEVIKARVMAQRELSTRAVEIPQDHIEQMIGRDTEVAQLRGTIANKKQILAAAAQNSVTYKNTEREIAAIEQQIEERLQAARPKAAEQLRGALIAQQLQELDKLEDQRKTQEMMVSLFTERADAERKKVQERSGKSVEIEKARSELARAEAVHQRIAERIIQLQTEARAPDRVTVVMQAIPPRFPVETWPMKPIALALGGGFCFPFAAFVLWAWAAKRVYEPDQIYRDTKLNVIGEIAALPVRSLAPRPGRARRFQRDSLIFEESIHSLRTALSVNDSIREHQALVIASAVSGEGKTNLSAQLAISLARCSREPVLLIDCDLRAPELHSMFDIDEGPGLAELLRGECTLDQSLSAGWGQNLHILPAGRLRGSSPHVLLSGHRFERVMAGLRKRYGRIVIDSPPVLTASESLVVCKAADAALLCTLRDHSRSPQIKQACSRLSMAGVQIAGAVLNGTPTRNYLYQYGTY
jgi:succinoglycan biosynthesis transport protein ExoP